MTELETACGLTQRMIENEAAIELLDTLYGSGIYDDATERAVYAEFLRVCGGDLGHAQAVLHDMIEDSLASGAMYSDERGLHVTPFEAFMAETA